MSAVSAVMAPMTVNTVKTVKAVMAAWCQGWWQSGVAEGAGWCVDVPCLIVLGDHCSVNHGGEYQVV